MKLPNNVKKRKDGSYSIDKTINGIRKYKYVRPPEELTPRKQIEWLEDKKVELFALWTGNYVKPLSFGAVLQMYLDDTSNKRIGDTTRALYSRQQERLTKALGMIQIDRMSCYDIQKYIDSLSSGTAETNAGIIASVLQYARKRKMKDVDPDIIKDVVIPERISKVKNIYNASEVKQILTELAEYSNDKIGAYAVAQMRLFVEWALQSGMRTGELLGTDWRDIDSDNKTVYVHQQLIKQDGKPAYIKPQTKNSKERTINIPDRVVDLLREYMIIQQQYRKQHKFKDNGMVFIDHETGGLIQRHSIGNWWIGFCNHKKIRHLSAHNFRHYFATTLLDNGATIATVAKVIGDEVATVIDYYIKAEAGAEIKACEIITSAIENALKTTQKLKSGVNMGYIKKHQPRKTAV
jgi:integrase